MRQHIMLGRGRFVHKQHLNHVHHKLHVPYTHGCGMHGCGLAAHKTQGLGVNKHHIKPLKFIF